MGHWPHPAMHRLGEVIGAEDSPKGPLSSAAHSKIGALWGGNV